MNDLTIRQKLYMVFGLLLIIITATNLFSGYSLNSINNGAMRIATEHLNGVMAASNSNQTLTDYRQGEYSVFTATTLPNRIYAIQQTKKLGDQLDIAFKDIEPTLTGDNASLFQTIVSNWQTYRKNSEVMINLISEGKHAEAAVMLDKSKQDYQVISNDLTRLLDAQKDFIHAETADAEAKYAVTRNTLIFTFVIILVLSAFMGWYLSSTIQKSITYLMNISKEIAGGNLTVDVSAKTNDEFGELTNSYKDTVHNLRTLIGHIHKTAQDVSGFAKQLTENAEQSAQATNQVAMSITNVASNANMQETAVSNSSNDINLLAENLKGFANKASASNEAAHNVQDIASHGAESIADAVRQMEEISEAVIKSAEVIKQLAERSNEIGTISDTISNIASQTNLLALNAAIEAARAGEAGRGFAVVAEEVRKLAEESNTAALRIADLISDIQQDTDQAVNRMNQGTEVVKAGQEVVTNAGDAFNQIVIAVKNLAEHSRDILNEATSSSSNAANLVSNMAALEKTGREVATETESVSAATEEQAASMDEIANASRKMAELSVDLQNATDKFKI